MFLRRNDIDKLHCENTTCAARDIDIGRVSSERESKSAKSKVNLDSLGPCDELAGI